jgi:hypothetical protein
VPPCESSYYKSVEPDRPAGPEVRLKELPHGHPY